MADVESSHVLLVDDSLTDGELTIYALKVRGRHPRVTWLVSAKEALLYMFREGHYSDRQGMPDLLLLDINMPGIGGIGVLQQLKCHPHTRRVPIVILSSSRDRCIVRQCYELGANGYVIKPAAPLDYFRTIGELANYWLRLNEQVEDEAATGAGVAVQTL